MPRTSVSFSSKQTFPCPVEGCCTQIQLQRGFTRHVKAKHPGSMLEYPGNNLEVDRFLSSDAENTNSPPTSPNGLSKDHLSPFFEDDYPLDFNFNNDEDTPAVNLGHSNSSSVDEEFIPVASSQYHPLINGIYYLFYFITAVKMNECL